MMMANNFYLFIAITYLASFTFCHKIEYHLTSFLQREGFINKSTHLEEYSLYDSQNITIRASYVSLHSGEENSLVLTKDRVEKTSKSSANDDHHIYSSITSLETSAILENLIPKEKTFYTMQMEGCLTDSAYLTLLMQRCRRYKAVYIELIRSLMQNLYLWPVAIISDEDECALMFSTLLQKELKQVAKIVHPVDSQSSSTHLYKLNLTRGYVRDISNALFELRIQSASIIVLLCSDEVSTAVFKVASKFSALRFKKVWLMIQSKTLVKDDIAPSQLLVVRVDDAPPALETSLLTKRRSVDAVNLMLVAEDVKKRGIVSPSVVSSLINVAKTKISDKNLDDLHGDKTAIVSLRKPHSQWIPLYKWSDHDKLVLITNDPEFLRISRSNLQGLTLRIVTVFENPYIMQFDKYFNKDKKACTEGIKCRVPTGTVKGTIWNETCCIGYLIDFLNSLQDDLWFSTDLYVVEDGFYGAVVNGTWNGMVGDLLKGKADLSIAAITSNKQRSAVIDFSEPFMEVDLSILMRTEQAKQLPFLNFAFVNHLSNELLWSILAVFITGMLFVWLLEIQSRCTQRKFQKFRKYPMKECFTYCSGLTFQRDLGGPNPQQFAARITAIAFAFGMVIIMTTYTAMLTASKVQQAEEDPFRGMKDERITNPTSAFKFSSLANSSTAAYFKNSENPTFRNMYLFMKDYNVKSSEIGVRNLLNGKLDAFITEYPVAKYYAAKQGDCGLRIFKTDNGKSSWAVAVKKGWSWKYLVSQKILQYRENGFFIVLHKKWMSTYCGTGSNSTSTLSRVPIEYFGGLIVVLVGMVFVSLFLLLIENGYNRYQNKIIEPVKTSFSVWKEERERRMSNVEVISFRTNPDIGSST